MSENVDNNRDHQGSSCTSPPPLFQIHIAEYQVLVTRSTYFMILSSSIWPALLLFLSLVAYALDSFAALKYGPLITIWVTGLVVGTTLCVWAQLLLEQYKMILYIEKYLRPMLRGFVDSPRYLLYEPLMIAQRKASKLPPWWEFSIPAGLYMWIVATAMIRCFYYQQFGRLDWLGLLFSLAIFAGLTLKCADAFKTRLEWEASEPEGTELDLAEIAKPPQHPPNTSPAP